MPESSDEIISFLVDKSRLDLSQYTVVGRWMTSDVQFKDSIKKWVDRYRNIVKKGDFKIQSALICAPSGSGKTFFVKECYRNMRPDFVLKRINIGEIHDQLDLSLEKYFNEILHELDNGNYIVSFVDEFDVDINGDYIFRYFLDILQAEEVVTDGIKRKIKNVFFFFVGSGSNSISEFEEFTDISPKQLRSKDFLRRISTEDRINLPDLNWSYEEKVVRAISCAIRNRPDVTFLEKKVLYWIGATRFESAHGLKSVMNRTCDALGNRTILEFDDIAIDAEKRHAFISRHSKAFATLKGSLIQVNFPNGYGTLLNENGKTTEKIEEIWLDLRIVLAYLNNLSPNISATKRFNTLLKIVAAIDATKSIGNEDQHNGLLALRSLLREGLLPTDYFKGGVKRLLDEHHFKGVSKKAAEVILTDLAQVANLKG